MKPKSLLILIVAAAALGLVAYLASRKSSEAPASANEKLFATLNVRINDAAAIQITTKDKSLTIEKKPDAPKGEEWTVASSGGYPADFEKVKPVLVQLSNAAIVETKTSKPENYQMIGVEEPSKPGSGSTLLTVKDAKGETLASVIIGENATSTAGPMGGPGTNNSKFVRRAGEAQSYLAKDLPAADASLMSWVKPEIMKIESTRIKSVTITSPAQAAPAAPDGSTPPVPPTAAEKIEIVKTDDTNFALANMPPGRELKYPGVASGVAGALGYLNMEDVVAASSLDPAAPATISRFETTDGLIITAKTIEKDGKTWTTFAATTAPPAPTPVPAPIPDPAATPTDPNSPTPPAAPQPASPADANPADPATATPPTTPAPATPPAPAKTDDKIINEAEELNRRLAPWAFALSTYTVGQLRSSLKDLLKEETAPVPPPAAPGPIGPASPQVQPPPPSDIQQPSNAPPGSANPETLPPK